MSLVSTQKKENNIVELEIAVSAEELEKASAEAFRQKGKTITVPGFRKGKAPRSVIEKMYGDIFVQDAIDDLYPGAYEAAVEEAGIEPVDRASVEMLSLEKDTGFTFKATVTVKPDVTINAYKGLKVDKIIRTAGEEEIGAEIERQRTRHARIINVEDGSPAKEGDMALIDFEGFMDGVAFEGGQGEDYQLKLGSHQFIEGFEEQIIGHKVGEEFDVNVTFPEEYHAEELQGKPALFKVTLKELQARELPVVDDEFAKDISEFDTLDELKEDLRKKIQEDLDKHTVEVMENALLDQVIASMEADIPDCMIEHKIDDMVQEFSQRMRAQGITMDTYLSVMGMQMEDYRNTFREQADRQVKTRLALEKIADMENIQVDESEYEDKLKEMADAYKIDVDKLRRVIQRKDLMGDIRCNLALDLVRDNAEITEKKAEDVEAKDEDADKANAEPEKKKTTRKRTTKKKDADAEAADKE